LVGSIQNQQSSIYMERKRGKLCFRIYNLLHFVVYPYFENTEYKTLGIKLSYSKALSTRTTINICEFLQYIQIVWYNSHERIKFR